MFATPLLQDVRKRDADTLTYSAAVLQSPADEGQALEPPCQLPPPAQAGRRQLSRRKPWGASLRTQQRDSPEGHRPAAGTPSSAPETRSPAAHPQPRSRGQTQHLSYKSTRDPPCVAWAQV